MNKILFGFTRKPMPPRCPDCQAKLPEPVYERMEHWVRRCVCGCYVQWSWPNVFRRRHVLALFDDGKVLGEA